MFKECLRYLKSYKILYLDMSSTIPGRQGLGIFTLLYTSHAHVQVPAPLSIAQMTDGTTGEGRTFAHKWIRAS